MRLHPIPLILTTFGIASLLVAAPDQKSIKPEAVETAIDNLLSERHSLKAFNTLAESARTIGVSEQAILEARFLFNVDMREDAAIAAMLPAILKQEPQFKIEDSIIFATKEDWLAVVEYIKAIHSLQNGNKQGFKQHITEAFWLSPRQAAAFASHIERLRQEEVMQTITIDFNHELDTLDGSNKVSLKSVLHNNQALLIHFWSPQSRESEDSIPDFVKTATMLSNHRIAILSLTLIDSPETLKKASEMIKPYRQAASGTWLVDSIHPTLGETLHVQNLPTMVIISPNGKILFNGDPTDDLFWQSLKNIDPNIERPSIDGNYDQ